MPVTHVAVFYGAQSGLLRGIVVPNDDKDIDTLVAPPGVAIIKVPLAQADPTATRGAIAAHTKTAAHGPDDDRCCVVDNTSTVVAIIKADPLVDAVPGMTLVLSQVAQPSDVWDGTVFSRRWVVAATTTGMVLFVVMSPLGTTPVVQAGQFTIPSMTLQVGQVAPIPRASRAVAV